MKQIVKYWIPPLLWMVFFFPVLNTFLGSPAIYRALFFVLKIFSPDLSAADIYVPYIVIRKLIHFVEYAVLTCLLFRAFKGESPNKWSTKWAVYSGIIAIGYGILDEFLQTFIPTRNGSIIDSLIDTAGVFAALGVISLKAKNKDSHEKKASFLKKANFLKRPFDILLSFCGIVLSSPFWIVLAFLIWLEDRGPVFYTQERMGRSGHIFKALKFRSMIIDAEKEHVPIQATENDSRVTRVGKYMRKTAMDELPQLINIFKGDMSFVGPRALRPQEKEVNGDGSAMDITQIPGFLERSRVKPGLTGLAQIFLSADAPRRKKFRYDSIYIGRQSFCFDIKLICLSFWITFRAKWESQEQKVFYK